MAGIILCAVWEDGKLLVGVTRRPLREVVAPYEEEIGRLRDELQTGAASIALRRSAHCML